MIPQIRNLFGFGGPQTGCGDSGTDIDNPYSGARITKLNNHWMPKHFSGDQAIRESWDLLTARIRDRVRNDSALTKCKETLLRLVIGTGIHSYSNASELMEEDEQLVGFEVESDTWFERWAESEADAEGEHSWWELQRLAFGDVIEAGNALFLETIRDDPSRTVPLAYQLLEWEQIDKTVDRDAEWSRNHRGRRYNRISNGVEFDSLNRKVAYYVYDAHPYDSSTGWSFTSRRIPASRILHLYQPQRPSAKLGVTWFAPLMQTNQDLDRYVANELTTRALTALLGVAIKTNDKNASVGLDAEDPDTGLPSFKLGYPHIGVLNKDDEIEVVETKRDTKEANALINLLLNLQAMGCRISLNRLLGDPSRANLASIKASHQDDEAMVAPIQQTVARRLVLPVRHAHTRWGFAQGLFRNATARDYQRQPWRYNTCSVIASDSVDLDQEAVESAIDRMRSGLSTYQDECAKRGTHWRRNLRKMKTVNEIAREMGVVLDWTKGQGSVPDSATSIAGDQETQNASPGA